jgi:hypothetical protein
MRTALRASTHNDRLRPGPSRTTLIMVSEVNRQWRLRRRPEGALTPDVFEWVTQPTQAPGEGEVRVRVLELSLDPANRVWIAGPSYRPAVEIGAVMDGFAVGEVVESRSEAVPVGTLVSGDLGWQDYAIRSAKDVRPLPAGSEQAQAQGDGPGVWGSRRDGLGRRADRQDVGLSRGGYRGQPRKV